MTRQILSRHLELRRQLTADMELLASLESAAEPGAQRLDGMPHASGVSDRVGDLAVEIADMRETVDRCKADIASTEAEAEAYIQAIRDSQTRMIFRLRFIRGMAWKDVAGAIGGYNTASGVRAICYRYLQAHADDAAKT